MNSLMNIVVRVSTQNAQQLASLKSQLSSISTVAESAGRKLGGWSGALQHTFGNLENFGKNLQWAGRQLEFRFTLPILAAGAAATKFAIDNETAFTRLKRVYGSFGESQQQTNSELGLLRKGFEALSNTFGVHQKDVLNIAADWAQAGYQGIALAKATKLTMETMILGEQDAGTATKSLITIMQQWGLTTDQTRKVLADLNFANVTTAASFGDIIDAITRSGATAKVSGVDIQHLAAMVASLVPATGSASAAGNGLKTIISRLMAPTKDTVDLLGKMGINLQAFMKLDATRRIEQMAAAFVKLPAAQQAVVASLAGGRFQINRFAQAMRDIASPAGNYQKVLRGTADETKTMALYQKQLQTVLNSTPQSFKILMVSIENALARAIVPMIPVFLKVLGAVRELVSGFTHLSPGLQKFILFAILFVAAMGPVIAYLGATILLVSQFGKAIAWLAVRHAESAAARAAAEELAAKQSYLAWQAAVQAMSGNAVFAAAQMAAAAEAAAVANEAAAAQSAAAWTAADTVIFEQWLFGAARMFSAFGELGTGVLELTAGTAAGVSAIVDTTATEITAATVGAEAAIGGLSVGWIAAIAAAVVAGIALVVHFRKQIGGAIEDAVRVTARALSQLPGIFVRVFEAVVRVVASAVKAVYKLFSYLNPFARHSPSLVEEVIRGVDVISAQYARLAGIGSIFRSAIAELTAFKAATAAISNQLAAKQFGEDRAAVTAIDPSAGPAVDALVAKINELKSTLAPLTEEFARQSQVVSEWKQRLDSANKAVDDASAELDRLRDAASAASDELNAAKDVLDGLKHTDISGMKAMNDQIFANEMAQKRLRLEILKLQDAGQSVDDLRDKFAKLQGQIELLRGMESDLRKAGAGSDVLGTYDGMIGDLQKQQDALSAPGGNASQIDQLKAQLDELQRQGEILDLTYSTTFDPLVRQIDEVTKGVNEMPFDELLSKIKAQQAEVNRLTDVWNNAEAAVKNQESVVKELTASRDQIQKTYDDEKAKLDLLGQSYDAVTQQIQDMEQALSDLVSAAKAAQDASKESNADKLFNAAAGGDFSTGNAVSDLGKEAGDLQAYVDQLLKDMNDKMGKFDPFAGIREQFHKFASWLATAGAGLIVGALAAILLPVDWPILLAAGIGAGIAVLGRLLGPAIVNGLKAAWDWAKTQFGPIFSGLGDALGPIFNAVGAAFGQLGQIFDTIGGAIAQVFTSVLGPVFTVFADVAKSVWHIVSEAISIAWSVIKPVWDTIVDVLGHVLKPVVELIATVFTTAWDIIAKAVDVAWNHLIKPIWDIIYQVITTALVPVFQMLAAIVEIVFALIGRAIQFWWDTIGHPIFTGIEWLLRNVVGPVFHWLADNVISPVMGFIGTVIKTAYDATIKPVFDAIKWAVENVVAPVFNFLLNVVSKVFDGIVGFIKASVNQAIDLFNALAHGINWVADKLHLSIHIDDIPHIGGRTYSYTSSDRSASLMASGGIIGGPVGPGFVTNGARAIVGEGNPLYPEWVIPTDPRYRKNAMKLFGEVGSRLNLMAGGGQIPHYIGGGILSGLVQVVEKVGRDAVAAGFLPFKLIADHLLSLINIPIVSGAGKRMIDDVYTWVKGDHPKAANGALVRGRPGGVLVRVGEAGYGHDEVIQPLPRANRINGEGKKEFNFYGDLSFPNIKSGDDAKKFIDNLEALVA